MDNSPERLRTHLIGLGIPDSVRSHWNLTVPALYEEIIRRKEGLLTEHGALVFKTGKYTGRSPNDKFVVQDNTTRDAVDWGPVNKAMSPEAFDALWQRVASSLRDRDLFVQDCLVGAHTDHQISVRIVAQHAWHALFARNMFVRPAPETLGQMEPEFTVLHAPDFQAVPERDKTASNAFIALDFSKKRLVIGGTAYAGEVKKSMFTVMNFLLPPKGVMPMHCSANVGDKGDVALFFGLSGTGKTTLSADPARKLIGDDEHGWGDRGVFNFEGGCYAKAIRLSPEAEPEIYATTRRFGSVLENVAIDPATRVIDLDSESLTENTRICYEIGAIPNAMPGGRAGQPQNIFFLTADAFGVLPPIAKLTPEQAAYHFLSGYTAKVAGTEVGIKEPKETFSACFGAPFMPRHPGAYAKLLTQRIASSGAQAWLVSTGWTGGPYGVGSRMKIAHTRAMLHAALDGKLNGGNFETDPHFGLQIPKEVPGVPSEILHPARTWKDPKKYEAQAKRLADMFRKNFERFAEGVSPEIRAAGPKA